ncbi:MAG: biotin/lipoyl-containing protein, partial [Woeseia sp.]
MSDNTDIIIPDLGDFADVEVIEVLVASGDKVAREDGLITLETDKATMDVPAPADGIIDSLTVS